MEAAAKGFWAFVVARLTVDADSGRVALEVLDHIPRIFLLLAFEGRAFLLHHLPVVFRFETFCRLIQDIVLTVLLCQPTHVANRIVHPQGTGQNTDPRG